MPAKTIHHDTVVHALEKDGWQITHDPYRITVGHKELPVDLAAEKVFAAERQGKRIAITINAFAGASEVHDLFEALGQYSARLPFLRTQDSERLLYLAVPREAFQNVFEEPIGRKILAEYNVRLLIFDPHLQEICQWTQPP